MTTEATTTPACPGCSGTSCLRWGRGAAGRQKYRCRGCGRQFVEGSDHLIDPETKAIVTRLLLAGVAPKQVKEAVPNISLRWIYYLKKQVNP